MDSDEGYNYEYDEEDECSEDSAEEEPEDDTLELGEVELVDPVVAVGERDEGGETGVGGHGPGEEDEEDYRFEVLTAEQILQHMVECIREVNEVIQVGILVCQRQESPGFEVAKKANNVSLTASLALVCLKGELHKIQNLFIDIKFIVYCVG